MVLAPVGNVTSLNAKAGKLQASLPLVDLPVGFPLLTGTAILGWLKGVSKSIRLLFNGMETVNGIDVDNSEIASPDVRTPQLFQRFYSKYTFDVGI